MKKKKNDLHSIPDEMQATLNQEKERNAQCRRERLNLNIVLAKKKMKSEFFKAKSEDEFVKAKPNDEFVKDDSANGDVLINPVLKGNDGEILSRDV